jgi:hypothetical protein
VEMEEGKFAKPFVEAFLDVMAAAPVSSAG